MVFYINEKLRASGIRGDREVRRFGGFVTRCRTMENGGERVVGHARGNATNYAKIRSGVDGSTAQAVIAVVQTVWL